MGLFHYYFFVGVFATILALKEELMISTASNVQLVLKELILMKKDCDE